MTTVPQEYWQEVYWFAQQRSTRALLTVEGCSEQAFVYFDAALAVLRGRADGTITDDQDDEASDQLGKMWLTLPMHDQETLVKIFAVPTLFSIAKEAS